MLQMCWAKHKEEARQTKRKRWLGCVESDRIWTVNINNLKQHSESADYHKAVHPPPPRNVACKSHTHYANTNARSKAKVPRWNPEHHPNRIICSLGPLSPIRGASIHLPISQSPDGSTQGGQRLTRSWSEVRAASERSTCAESVAETFIFTSAKKKKQPNWNIL